jgi:NAD(P)-dependent dehydrogenase (short-subunit alcohol dehydrogenase family)
MKKLVALLLQGAVVFAGCVKSQSGGAQELRELNLKRLHVIQMDVTSDEQVATAVAYVSRHIPPQGICQSLCYPTNALSYINCSLY